MGGSVGQQEMVVIHVLGGTDPCTPAHARNPAAPKPCSFSACFFYLESFPQTLSQTGMSTHTHSLSPLWLSSDQGGRQPLQGTACLLEGRRSHPWQVQIPCTSTSPWLGFVSHSPCPQCGKSLSHGRVLQRGQLEAPHKQACSWGVPGASASSQPHYIFAFDLNQAHDQVPSDM